MVKPRTPETRESIATLEQALSKSRKEGRKNEFIGLTIIIAVILVIIYAIKH